ncbi:hypothetical protein OAQ84_00425 [Bdellovibrionales bacterium]|nr:hypothetical protein [Bdellovibrionales bacterium]
MSKYISEESKINEFFKPARDLEVEPPSFIRAKVLARLDEKRSSFFETLYFRRFIYASIALFLLALSIKVILPSNQQIQEATYTVGKKYLMKVSVQELNLDNISYVEIIPSKNITFLSKKFPDVSQTTSLKLLGDTVKSLSHLPIAFTANSEGSESVQIHFYDKNLDIIFEKHIQLEVHDG